MTADLHTTSSNQSSESAAAAPATVAPTPAAATAPVESVVGSEKHTAGEKLYKWTVHGGINFLLNESIGMAWMWAGTFGKGKKFGGDLIYKMTNDVTPRLEKFLGRFKPIKPHAHMAAEQMVDIGLLTMGGNILMIPIKMIEEHKLYWVKKADALLDKLHGHPNDLTPQMKADREAAYDRIQHEDKPSWGRVIGARASSIAFNTATLTAWKLMDKNPDPDRRGTGRISNWVADQFTGTVKPNGYKYPNANGRWWTNTVILETISTMVTASIFYVKYEILDRKEKKKELQAKGIEPTRLNTAPNDLVASTFVLPSVNAQPEMHASAEVQAPAPIAAHPAANETSHALAQHAAQHASPESTVSHAERHAPATHHTGSHAERIHAERGGHAVNAQAHEGHAAAIESRGESFSAAATKEKEHAQAAVMQH